MFKKFLYRSGLNVFIVSYFWRGAQKEFFKSFKIPPAGRYFKLIGEDVYVDIEDFKRSGRKLFLLAKKTTII